MRKDIEKRVISSAENILYQQNYVSFINVLISIGWLKQIHFEDWRRNRVPYLEKIIEANLSKISYAMQCFKKWAINKGLKPSNTIYLTWGKGVKRKLRFSKSGNSNIELAYSTHYVSPILSEKKQQELLEKQEQPPELLAFIISKASTCSKCKKEIHKNGLLYIEEEQVFCMDCSRFSKFIFLPSGNSKLTRLAKKHSSIYVVVVKFSKSRKRYERHGLLISQEVLQLINNNIETEIDSDT